MKTIISTPLAPQAIGPYSQAVRWGQLLTCSGQIPLDPKTMQITAEGIEAQTEQVLKNMKEVLTAAGASYENIIKTTVFLKNMADFQKMNGVYSRYLGEHKPARSTIEVSRLPLDALVEIECIAVIP